MSTLGRILFSVFALSGVAATLPLTAHADAIVAGESYPHFSEKVGSQIYTTGPLVPMHEFKLEMKMAHPTMNVIKMDRQKAREITCTMVPAGTNNDMAILDCTPKS